MKTFAKQLKKNNDILIKSNENANKSFHEKIGFIIEKINEIEKNLKDIRENVFIDTIKLFNKTQVKILDVCDENLKTIKNVWEEFNKIKEETKANIQNILSIKQSLDKIQNKLHFILNWHHIWKKIKAVLV